MRSPCGPYHYPCLPRNSHLSTEKESVLDKQWQNAGWSQRLTHPFQRNLQILDSLACHCDWSRDPFQTFQTCTCLMAKRQVTSDQPEQQWEQKLTSDLTWHPSSHVSSSKASHVAHVIHAAKAPTTHSCQQHYWPSTCHHVTRHLEVSKSHTSAKPVHSSITWSIHACDQKVLSGILLLVTGKPFLSHLFDTYWYDGRVKWRTQQMLAMVEWFTR